MTCGLVVMPVIGGCAATRPSPASFSVRHVAVPQESDVLESAALVVRDFGYRLDTVNRQARRLSTHPLEFSAPDTPRRTGSAGSRRRLVEIRIGQRESASAIYCKVLVQRQTTEAHRLFAPDQRGDDLPGRTPIEREAATPQEHNVVWETVGRDKAHERAILSALAETVAPPVDRNG